MPDAARRVAGLQFRRTGARLVAADRRTRRTRRSAPSQDCRPAVRCASRGARNVVGTVPSRALAAGDCCARTRPAARRRVRQRVAAHTTPLAVDAGPALGASRAESRRATAGRRERRARVAAVSSAPGTVATVSDHREWRMLLPAVAGSGSPVPARSATAATLGPPADRWWLRGRSRTGQRWTSAGRARSGCGRGRDAATRTDPDGGPLRRARARSCGSAQPGTDMRLPGRAHRELIVSS